MGCHLSTLYDSSHIRGRTASLAKGRLHGSFQQKYALGAPLGTGSFGEVKTCTKRQTNREFAVKIMPKRRRAPSQNSKSVVNRVDVREMFRNEAGILKGLDHGNIVKVHDAYEDSSNCYLVMERHGGGELFTHIASQRVFTEGHAALVSRQMLAALNYIHRRRIVHRDIKAENFVFSEDSDKSKIVLVDFGMAVKLSKDSHLRQVCGSPHYVAPELLKGRYQWQVDLWAFGVILYLMLYGEYPFEAVSHRAILRKALLAEPNYHQRAIQPLSHAALDLLRSLLCKNPNNRLTAAEALCHPWLSKIGSPLRQHPQRHALADSDATEGVEKKVKQSLSFQPDKEEGEVDHLDDDDDVVVEGPSASAVGDIKLARLPTGSRTLSSAVWDDNFFESEESHCPFSGDSREVEAAVAAS